MPSGGCRGKRGIQGPEPSGIRPDGKHLHRKGMEPGESKGRSGESGRGGIQGHQRNQGRLPETGRIPAEFRGERGSQRYSQGGLRCHRLRRIRGECGSEADGRRIPDHFQTGEKRHHGEWFLLFSTSQR